MLRILPVALLLAMQVGSLKSANPPLFTWWVVNPLVKVKPLDPVPNPAARTAELYAGRNEFEPFQIVLRPGATDASEVDVEVSDFTTSDGAWISQSNVTIYIEQFIDLIQPSSIDGGTGLWPDALIPRVDRYANERRNAFPFSVERGHNQPLWIEVFVPPAARPGNYSASVRITHKGAVDCVVPIHLTVWAFELPSTATLKSSFGLNGTTALKQHRGRYTSDEDLYALTRLYAKAALLHRVSIHGGNMVPPKYKDDGGHMDLDWHSYDAEAGPFLDGTAMNQGEPLQGARATSVELLTPSSFETPDGQVEYWRSWVKHFHQKGWDDRLFLYLWDEPSAGDRPKVVERGRAALRAVPNLRTLLTLPFNSELQGLVKIWVPLVNCLKKKPAFDDYCADSPALETYGAEIQHGRSLWFYQSCASHGCNSTGGLYFTGWPSYVIDAPGNSNRVMQWVAWKYRIEGELYYSMNEAYAYDKDPWSTLRIAGGNGDGTLFYPGRPGRIGGQTDIPIESIRLKLIREGMEDYEYLALLAKLAGKNAADMYSDRIVKEPYLWELQPEALLKVRWELGDRLDRLTRAQTGKRE